MGILPFFVIFRRFMRFYAVECMQIVCMFYADLRYSLCILLWGIGVFLRKCYVWSTPTVRNGAVGLRLLCEAFTQSFASHAHGLHGAGSVFGRVHRHH